MVEHTYIRFTMNLAISIIELIIAFTAAVFLIGMKAGVAVRILIRSDEELCFAD
jgi:hypothetical protein